jgi:hypothetical protein
MLGCQALLGDLVAALLDEEVVLAGQAARPRGLAEEALLLAVDVDVRALRRRLDDDEAADLDLGELGGHRGRRRRRRGRLIGRGRHRLQARDLLLDGLDALLHLRLVGRLRILGEVALVVLDGLLVGGDVVAVLALGLEGDGDVEEEGGEGPGLVGLLEALGGLVELALEVQDLGLVEGGLGALEGGVLGVRRGEPEAREDHGGD